MHFSTASFLAVLAASFATAAEQMKINYYNDACSSYAGQVDVTWATKLYGGPDNCYNYHFGSYANIANCYEGRCLCNFFSQQNCGGSAIDQVTNSGNCIQVQKAQSFACYYS